MNDAATSHYGFAEQEAVRKRYGLFTQPAAIPQSPAALRVLAERADDALRRLALLKHDASISEWCEAAAPIAALILAARTI